MTLTPRAPAAARLWPALLLAAALLPIWAGAYPPLYDYQAHLLEARVAARFADPALAYADGFVLRPSWPLESNALFTLAAVGLSRLAPLDVAGQLTLSLSLAIFLFGLRGLLQRAGTAGALLPLAPLLAYNFTFASGWLNFALATGLGLCALGSYEGWARAGGRRHLGWLALLLLLIYSAHLVVWGLLALTLGVRAAADRLPPRRAAALAAAAAVTLPLTLTARPALAALLLVGPAAWLGAYLIGRLRLQARALAAATPALAVLLFGLGVAAAPALQRFDPELRYAPFERATFPIRTFTLAQQLPARDPLLSAANVGIAALLLAAVGLLAAGARQADDGGIWRRLAPVGALALLYGAAPSYTGDLAVLEPRILLWAGLLALAAVRLPPSGRLRRAAGGVALAAGLLASAAYTAHAVSHGRQAAEWRSALLELGPRPRLLVLQSPRPPAAEPLLRFVESSYNAVYISARAPIELGGASTRVFGNGPFYLRPDLEIGAYLWRYAGAATALSEACPASRGLFTAVVGWGPLDEARRTALDACFGPGQPRGYLTFWRP